MEFTILLVTKKNKGFVNKQFNKEVRPPRFINVNEKNAIEVLKNVIKILVI